MRYYLAPFVSFLTLTGCTSSGTPATTPASVATAVGNDSVSALDADVQALTAIDKGLALVIAADTKAGAPVPGAVSQLVADAHKARALLEAAQKGAAPAADALSAFAAVATAFQALPSGGVQPNTIGNTCHAC